MFSKIAYSALETKKFHLNEREVSPKKNSISSLALKIFKAPLKFFRFLGKKITRLGKTLSQTPEKVASLFKKKVKVEKETTPSKLASPKEENPSKPLSSEEKLPTPNGSPTIEEPQVKPSKKSSSSSSSEELEELPPLWIDLNIKPNKKKRISSNLHGYLSEKCSLDKKKKQTLKELSEIAPYLQTHLGEFEKRFPNEVRLLKEKGWEEGKTDPLFQNSTSKFERVRKEANAFVAETVNTILKYLEKPQFSTVVFGTPGWNSDVDIGMRSKDLANPLLTGDMIEAKLLCDLMTYEIFGALPGYALDTEWYIDLSFYSEYIGGKKAREDIAVIEQMMGALQAYEHLKGDEQKWADYKNAELEQTKNQTKKELKKKLFEDIEKWGKTLEKEAAAQLKKENQGTGKEAKRKAEVVSQWPTLMNLGAACSEIEKSLIGLNRELKRETGSNAKLLKERDELIVRHDFLYSIINSRQPEGTYSWSELSTTLFSGLGQKVQREKEAATKRFGKWYRKKGEKRSGEVEKKRLAFAPEEPKMPNLAQLAAAGFERLSFFTYVIGKGNVIEASKYLLRVAEATYYSLALLPKEKKKDTKIKKWLIQAKRFHTKAKYLERCKRKQNLSPLAAKELLRSWLKDNKITPKKNQLTTLLRTYEKEVNDKNGIVLRSEKVAILTSKLNKEFGIETMEIQGKLPTGKMRPKDDGLFYLLKAIAGYSTSKNSQIRPFFKQADKITLEKLKLETPEQVQAFGEKFSRLAREVGAYISEKELLQIGTKEDLTRFNLNATWKRGGDNLKPKQPFYRTTTAPVKGGPGRVNRNSRSLDGIS